MTTLLAPQSSGSETTITLYELQPKQQEFSDTFVKYRLFGGAKGGGKSYAARAECVKQCMSAPLVRGLVLRRTMPEVRENMITPLMRELPTQLYRYNGTTGIMTFQETGSTIWFTHCQNTKDVYRFQGLQFDFICIEELTQWTEEEFKILAGCLRGDRPGIVPNFFATANPGGIGHAWVKRLWIDRDFTEYEKPEEYAFIPAKVWDNYALLRIQPDYPNQLKALPEKLRRAYLDGDWDIFEGQYFREFRRDLHVVDPYIPMVGVKRRIIAFDYGYTNPSAVYWMALMNDDRIVIYRELIVTKHTYGMLARRILALTTEDEVIDFTVCDPAIVKKANEGTATTAEDDMGKEGLKIQGANNSRMLRWNKYREYLQPRTDPNTGVQYAKLTITSNCSYLIRTLPQLVHDERIPEDLDTRGEDHGADGSGYGIITLASAGGGMEQIAEMNKKMTKVQAESSKEREFRKRGMLDRSNILRKQF